jgi:hypothetical protein
MSQRRFAAKSRTDIDGNERAIRRIDSMRVTSFAWNALLDAISMKAPPNECISRSMSLYERMQRLDRACGRVADLSRSYESLMRSWLRSEDPGVVSQMELLYRSVIEQYDRGNKMMQPLIAMVDLLLEIYNELPPQERFAEKSYALFQEAVAQYKAGNLAMEPNRSTVWMVLAILRREHHSLKHEGTIDDIINWKKVRLVEKQMHFLIFWMLILHF